MLSTFDCYGTLIDWEAGSSPRFARRWRRTASRRTTTSCSSAFARHEATLEDGPYLRYREVLGRSLRGICADLGVEPTADEVATFGGSVGDWPAFPDSAEALAPAEGALQARGDHELRRRPVRGLERVGSG